jgi:hypothetical protein
MLYSVKADWIKGLESKDNCRYWVIFMVPKGMGSFMRILQHPWHRGFKATIMSTR